MQRTDHNHCNLVNSNEAKVFIILQTIAVDNRTATISMKYEMELLDFKT